MSKIVKDIQDVKINIQKIYFFNILLTKQNKKDDKLISPFFGKSLSMINQIYLDAIHHQTLSAFNTLYLTTFTYFKFTQPFGVLPQFPTTSLIFTTVFSLYAPTIGYFVPAPCL